ncbi:hypothetical protein D6C78_04308 [Aureobasidium pullulans]|uniref:MYND-type domain-containing protein n=1 Tax=Aureobasidium pullulans TaxID=5580 RepID=A0A4T0BTX5_AURPU|nr:hypothetical protein D6C78_04308 [Aureobasidium pullulans]
MAPCSNGACKNNGTRACSRCKNASYCGTVCQKVAWLKHKDVCVKPGVSTASKVVEERDAAYEIERSVMISPGTLLGTSLIGRKIPRPRAKIVGLLLANKQISHELLEIAVSQNVFLVPVNETIELNSPGNIFRRKFDPSLVSKIERLHINVCTEIDPFDDSYHLGVSKVQKSMDHVVRTLNEAGTTLKSLTVRYMSCYPGEVEEMRHDADALVKNPGARCIQVMRVCDGRLDALNLANMQAFYLHGANIASALEALTTPVKQFSAYGDISGLDLKRMYHHFNLPFEIEKPRYHLDRWGQKSSGFAGFTFAPDMEREHCRSSKARRARLEIIRGFSTPSSESMWQLKRRLGLSRI